MQRHRLSSAFAVVAAVAAAAVMHDGHDAPTEPDSYAQYVAVVTNGYCTAPARLRVALRKLIDAHAAPNKIRVECAADAL